MGTKNSKPIVKHKFVKNSNIEQNYEQQSYEIISLWVLMRNKFQQRMKNVGLIVS